MKLPRCLRATRALSAPLGEPMKVDHFSLLGATTQQRWTPARPHAPAGGFNPLPITQVDNRTTAEVIADMIKRST